MIEIKNRFTGEVIHSGDFELIKDCVEDAIKNEISLRRADLREANLLDANLRKADLRGADLYKANLRAADLRGADLREADLRGADLYGAELYGAELREADLRGAYLFRADLRAANLFHVNLRDADLRAANLFHADLREAELFRAELYGANLRDANLWWCAGNNSEIKSLLVSDVYPITYTAEYLQIGCEMHLISEWHNFDDAKIKQMDGEKALRFWRENKDFILSTIERFPAVKTGKEND